MQKLMKSQVRLRVGSAILALSAFGLLSASGPLLAGSPGVQSPIGRHLWAGALANASLAIVLAVVALGPLRRGERWAFSVYLIPLVIYGLPILALDMTNVPSDHLAYTIAPQILGIVMMLLGLAIAGTAVFGRSSPR